MVRRRAAVLAAGLMVAATALVACSDDGSEGAATTSSVPAPTVAGTSIVEADGWVPPGDAWVEVPAPPIDPSSTQVTAIPAGFLVMGWLDEGGEGVDPLLFDPQTGTWMVLPAPPIDHPVLNSSIVPTSTGFAVFGVRCGDLSEVTRTSDAVSCDPSEPVGLRYDLDAGWSSIDLPAGTAAAGEVSPGDRGAAVARIDGSLALVPIGDQWFTWGPDDAWAAIDAPPDDPSGTAVWGATRCVTDAGIVQVSGVASPPAAVLADDGTWEPVLLPVADAQVGFPLCTDDAVVVALRSAGAVDAGTFELAPVARRWARVEPVPSASCRGLWAVDGGGVGECETGELVALDGQTGTWRALDVGPDEGRAVGSIDTDGVAIAVVSADAGRWRFEVRDLIP